MGYWIRMYRASLKIAVASMLQYRMEILIWAIWGFVAPLISLAVWNAAAIARGGTISNGVGATFKQADFASYFLVSMIFNHIMMSWDAFEFAYRVRDGNLSPPLAEADSPDSRRREPEHRLQSHDEFDASPYLDRNVSHPETDSPGALVRPPSGDSGFDDGGGDALCVPILPRDGRFLDDASGSDQSALQLARRFSRRAIRPACSAARLAGNNRFLLALPLYGSLPGGTRPRARPDQSDSQRVRLADHLGHRRARTVARDVGERHQAVLGGGRVRTRKCT